MEYLDPQSFLTIFVSAALVILFGAGYVSIFTLVKMGKIKEWLMSAGYLSWGIQTYCLYLLSVNVKSDPYTQKVLLAAMVGYLIIPHFIYFLVQRTHEACEH